ncbi:hypothetical protein ASPZODRAFT_20865 [Penicilliopsis zonata CBS 506.65]|uniref:Uncharacterized protein n=1 Tax=Penicilliopsis zonata CBS 506.65 TaxID=1073090 RepID=A0A1L9S4B4_9EURO|nr:hypothetical protein ASPZODRAFT_20865 [Penicilliopsis zonata CBS 506.65]OJJ42017.1 hypothetical protein ASPZODRAFT_20865 [Penicilliopsis zonata CBS 506.65]
MEGGVISRASDIANSRAAMSGITPAEHQGARSLTTRNLLTLSSIVTGSLSF